MDFQNESSLEKVASKLWPGLIEYKLLVPYVFAFSLSVRDYYLSEVDGYMRVESFRSSFSDEC